MPVYNITLDDVSPMLHYSPGWQDDFMADAEFVNYFNQTFHATEIAGSNVTLQVNGSAVWAFGAKRFNHDKYNATLDGSTKVFDGFANPDMFQQTLFSATDLQPGLHILVLADASTVEEQPWFDIDFVMFTTGDGNSDTINIETSLDDTDPAVGYSEGFIPTVNRLNAFYFNETFHSTNVSGAQAQISFTGSAITLYGATSSNHGLYQVTLDGGEPITFNGTAGSFHPQTILYFASGLANTSHTVSLTNIDPDSSRFLDFDRAVVSQYFASKSGNQPGSTGASALASGHGAKSGTIAGSILGVIFLLVAIGLFLHVRRRHRLHEKSSYPRFGLFSGHFHVLSRRSKQPSGLAPGYDGRIPDIPGLSRVASGQSGPHHAVDEARSQPSVFLAGSETESMFEMRTTSRDPTIRPSISIAAASAGSSKPPLPRLMQLHVQNPSEHGSTGHVPEARPLV